MSLGILFNEKSSWIIQSARDSVRTDTLTSVKSLKLLKLKVMIQNLNIFMRGGYQIFHDNRNINYHKKFKYLMKISEDAIINSLCLGVTQDRIFNKVVTLLMFNPQISYISVKLPK